MRILIAIDSFKDFASSKKVGEWIAKGLQEVRPTDDVEIIPIGDGGEGTIEALIHARGGFVKKVQVHDPLFRIRSARIGLLDDRFKTGVLEIAEASGSAILDPLERDTMIATSYGTGELILAAINEGCEKIIVGLGGSIVSDGGMGMAQALGVQFYDKDGEELLPQKNRGFNALSLHKVGSIDNSLLDPRLNSVEFHIAADVTTRLLGPNGQAKTFGPQKGAGPEEIAFIENGLTNWANVLEETFGKNFNVELAGAAGGMGSGLAAFLHGRLELGITLVLREIGFDRRLSDCDLVITGEGKLDRTSSYGKACIAIAKKARSAGKKVAGIFGIIGDADDTLLDLFDSAIESNKQHVNVHEPNFNVEIGPRQIKEAGSELAQIL